MRFRTLEIRWHDSKPISSCDFQPVPLKKARPTAAHLYAAQAYRLATAGEDNHVRVWMVHPNIRPTGLLLDENMVGAGSGRPPRVEYLATLSRHSAAVNVVRFSPNGELIASAGDDGMIIIWAPSTSPQASTYGSDLSPEDLQNEKEYWKPRTTFRCTTMQVYDIAWSPTGEYIIAGSTDNTARVFAAADGKCVHEIAEHTHYVQGVAWDPLNEYIATQSSDRSMHIYRISAPRHGTFEAHAVGKNTRMPHRHSRTPSNSRPRMFRRDSTASEAESLSSEYPKDKDDIFGAGASGSGPPPGSQNSNKDAAPLTPATSVASTPSLSMFPPPSIDKQPSSRRSSFSGSNAPGSPHSFSRYGRSPSPMPPLPAIRAGVWASVKLYGDESFTNFFRRLTFSPDGGLLLTPAGQFEDPAVVPGAVKPSSSGSKAPDENAGTPTRGRKARPTVTTDVTPSLPSASAPASSVYVYSRANFAKPAIAQLSGYKKASVAVRFSPVLYELRAGVEGGGEAGVVVSNNSNNSNTTRTAMVERGVEGIVAVDINPMPTPDTQPATTTTTAQTIAAPTPHHVEDKRPPTPAASKPPTPNPDASTPLLVSTPTPVVAGPSTGSVFALPYRMLYAVVTMDAVVIYDTQQAGPFCVLTKLHYDEFTDMSWSPDGQCLILSSRDGYCTLVIFDEILPAHHTQQHTLQLQSIAQYHSMPISYPSSSSAASHATPSATPLTTPATNTVGLPFIATTPTIPQKRAEPPLTPTASVDGGDAPSASTSAAQCRMRKSRRRKSAVSR
ncbi:WD40-repeat-containing domain protein [Infundibulicybe gibba]|nr:WD40-repeat-containing domain protein [Infundibulicybe gibba]